MTPDHLLHALGEIDSRHLEGLLPQSPATVMPLYNIGSNRMSASADNKRFSHRGWTVAVCVLLCFTALLSVIALPYLKGDPSLLPNDTSAEGTYSPNTPSLVIPSPEMAPHADLPAYENAPYTMQALYTLFNGRTPKDGGYPTHKPYTVYTYDPNTISTLPAPLTGDTIPIYRIHSLQYTKGVMDMLANGSERAIQSILRHDAGDTIQWEVKRLQVYEVTEDTPSEFYTHDGKILDLYGSYHSKYKYRYIHNELVSVELVTWPGFYILNFSLKNAVSEDMAYNQSTTDSHPDGYPEFFWYTDPDEKVYKSACQTVAGLTDVLDMEITDYEIVRNLSGKAGSLSITLYNEASPSGPEMETLDTYGEHWYDRHKRPSITLSYESSVATEKSMLLYSVSVSIPITDPDRATYVKEDDLPLLSLSEAEYLLACGCTYQAISCRCRLCLADRSEVDMTDYDTVTMEYIRCPDEGLLIPCYVFWKYLYDEDGEAHFAQATVPAIPVSGLEEYFSNDAEDHESFCTVSP
ncbi:MAG: hypothetical protein IJX72_04680 [Clostridia bacterium]|nr:hypothetical protein [Clostridia bacterium]